MPCSPKNMHAMQGGQKKDLLFFGIAMSSSVCCCGRNAEHVFARLDFHRHEPVKAAPPQVNTRTHMLTYSEAIRNDDAHVLE